MKKIWILLLTATILAGCGNTQDLETVNDVYEEPIPAVSQQILVSLPEELEAPAFSSEESGKLYLCDDYTVMVQTLPGGNLEQTVHTAAGMKTDALQIMKTEKESAKRYEFVWTYTDDQGVGVGRACILDDGSYHYVLTAQAQEEKAGQVQAAWQEMFASFRLIPANVDLSTGS